MATTPTSITRIDPSEYVDKGVIGLPDAPELSTLEMQEKFDEIAIDVIIPHINGMAGEIEGAVDGVDEALADEVARAQSAEQAITALISAEVERAVNQEDALTQAIADEQSRAEGAETTITGLIANEQSRAESAETTITELVIREQTRAEGAENSLSNGINVEKTRAITAEDALDEKIDSQIHRVSRELLKKGDMFKGTYDVDGNGIVDNAERLSGHEPSYFANHQDLLNTKQSIGDLSDLETTDKSSIVAAINEAASTGGGSGGEDAEAWAVGQRNGQDVPSTDPTYHNNSKYYSQQSEASAEDAETAASDASDIKDEISGMVGSVTFDVDFTTGEIVYSNDTTYIFTVNETTGNLEWEVVA